MELLQALFLGNFVVATEWYQSLHCGFLQVVVPFSLQPELKSSWEGIEVTEMLVEISDDFLLNFQQLGSQTTDDNGSINSSSFRGENSVTVFWPHAIVCLGKSWDVAFYV